MSILPDLGVLGGKRRNFKLFRTLILLTLKQLKK